MEEHEYFRDSEIALLDTLKLLFEILVAKGISSPETLDRALSAQATVYPPETMPRAIEIVALIRASITDPDRKALRELLASTPEGHA